MISGDTKKCSDSQKLATSRACPKFRTAPESIKDILSEGDTAEGFQEIASLVHAMSSSQLKAMAGAVLNEVTTRKQGYHMWQPVYVRYRGTARSNYMSNFMSARILNADRDVIRLISEDGQTVLRYPNTGLAGPSVYSKAEFIPLRDSMIERGADVDLTDRKTAKTLLPIDWSSEIDMPPVSKRGGIANIEDVARSNRSLKQANRARGRKGDDIADLTHIAQQIELGTARFAQETEDGEVHLTSNTSYRKTKPRKKTRIIEANDL